MFMPANGPSLHKLIYRSSLQRQFPSLVPVQENGGAAPLRTAADVGPTASISGGSGTALPELELLCAGQAVPLDMSLAAVKMFIWRRPEDMQIMYGARDPLHPAPLPQIKPPP